MLANQVVQQLIAPACICEQRVQLDSSSVEFEAQTSV